MTIQRSKSVRLSKISLILGAIAGSSLGAAALERNRLLSLELTVDSPNGATQSFGTLGAFMRRLRRAGHSCNFDSYENGGSVDCGQKDEPPRVLIHFDFEPSRAPEIAHIDSIRANGINGGETPAKEQVKFLNEFLRIKSSSSPE